MRTPDILSITAAAGAAGIPAWDDATILGTEMPNGIDFSVERSFLSIRDPIDKAEYQWWYGTACACTAAIREATALRFAAATETVIVRCWGGAADSWLDLPGPVVDEVSRAVVGIECAETLNDSWTALPSVGTLVGAGPGKPLSLFFSSAGSVPFFLRATYRRGWMQRADVPQDLKDAARSLLGARVLNREASILSVEPVALPLRALPVSVQATIGRYRKSGGR